MDCYHESMPVRLTLTFCVVILAAALLLRKPTTHLVDRGSAAMDDRLESSFQSWMQGETVPIIPFKDEAADEDGAWGSAGKIRAEFFHLSSMARQFASSRSQTPPLPPHPAHMPAPDATAGMTSYPVHALFELIESSACTTSNRRMPRPNENVSPTDLDSRGRMRQEVGGQPVSGSPAELIPFRDCQLYLYSVIPDVMVVHHQAHLLGPLDAKIGWRKEELLFVRSEQYDRDALLWIFEFDSSGSMQRSYKGHANLSQTEETTKAAPVQMTTPEAREFVAKEWDFWQDFMRRVKAGTQAGMVR